MARSDRLHLNRVLKKVRMVLLARIVRIIVPGKIKYPPVKLLLPAIILGIIWTFNNFNVVWLVSNSGEPSDTTHILVSWVYKAAFTYFRIGYAAAFSMIIFVILFVFSWRFIKSPHVAENIYN